MIKFCRRQRWLVICAVKTNRRIDQKRIDHHNQALRQKPYQRITLEAVDQLHKTPTYFTRLVQGHLEGFAEPVHAIICELTSKKRPGDKFPKYFVCTDLSLSVQQVLRYYQKRWPVEVDNFYLKDVLGLGDFRLQSFEATEKWFAMVILAINYLQFQARLPRLISLPILACPWSISSAITGWSTCRFCSARSSRKHANLRISRRSWPIIYRLHPV